MEVKERDGREEGHDDAQTRSEALEDVVRVFDDHGRDQTAEHLNTDCRPGPGTEIMEEG